MAFQDPLLLVIVLAAATLAFYWYFRHRSTDRLLRRYEGEHYGRARGRLNRIIRRDRLPDEPSEPTAKNQGVSGPG
ncbi:MAG TPA: hypothetical protein VHK06_06055 [Candidatus Limnocylindria bacterium]|nr:hypothetical protein [Candidatus Limnocylindria bacterium]